MAKQKKKKSESEIIDALKKATSVEKFFSAIQDAPLAFVSYAGFESPIVHRDYTEMYRKIALDAFTFIVKGAEDSVEGGKYQLVYLYEEKGWCLDGYEDNWEEGFDVSLLEGVYDSLRRLTEDYWMPYVEDFVNIEEFFDEAYHNAINISGLTGAERAYSILSDFLLSRGFKIIDKGNTDFERCSFGVITATSEKGSKVYKFGFHRPKMYRKDDRKRIFGLKY
jgi:hypothetical protein